MLTRDDRNVWRSGRINDSVGSGLMNGGRNGGGGRSRKLWGRAAAKKGRRLLERMVQCRTVTVKRLGGDEAGEKAIGRFLRNDDVSEAALIAAARAHVLAQVAGRRVLAIHDTSEINFSQHERGKAAFGRGGNGADPAFFVHPVLVVDADSGVVLGLLDVQLWERHGPAAKTQGARRTRKNPAVGWWAPPRPQACARPAPRRSAWSPIARAISIPPLRGGPPRSNCWCVPRPSVAWPMAATCSRISTASRLPIDFALDLPAVPGRAARRATMVLRHGPVALARPAAQH